MAVTDTRALRLMAHTECGFSMMRSIVVETRDVVDAWRVTGKRRARGMMFC